LNPSTELVKALDGTTVDGVAIRGVVFPVSFQHAARPLSDAITAHRPAVILSTGLWPGEAVIRMERFAVNKTDFEIPDNDGLRPSPGLVDEDGPDAYAVTLPVERIVAELRSNGIPARVSDTAGTYLCNTTLYRALAICKAQGQGALCGFMHLPYLPRQVSALLDELRSDGILELHQRADLASMSLEMMVEAARTALSISLAHLSRQ
jgi:pyroglutamyl-peptidase